MEMFMRWRASETHFTRVHPWACSACIKWRVASRSLHRFRNLAADFVIVQHNGLFFVGAQRGLYLLSSNHVRRLLPDLVYDITFSPRNPDVMYTAGGEGIRVLTHQGSDWTVIHKEHGSGQDFRTVIEGADGRVWGTTMNAIWRIDFGSDPATAEQFTLPRECPVAGTAPTCFAST